MTGDTVFRIDSTTTLNPSVARTGVISSSFADYIMNVTNLGQVAEFHGSGGFSRNNSTKYVTMSTPWVWSNFTPTAFIDRSQNKLIAAVYDPAAQDEWALINSVAEGEHAAVYFDQLGYPHYRTGVSNVTTAGRAVVRSVTTTNAVTTIDYIANISQIANDITVAWSEPDRVTDAQIFAPSAPVMIVARGTTTIRFKSPGQIFLNENINVNIGAGNTSADGTGTVIPLTQFVGNLVVDADGFGGVLTVENLSFSQVWLVDASGNNTLNVTASIIRSGSGGSSINYTNASSIRAHKSQPMSLGSSPWRQTEGASSTLAVRLLSELSEIIPVLKNVQIVGDPRLQIGDRIRITDLTALGVDDTYRISGLSQNVSSGGAYTCSLVARGSRNVAFWNQNKWNDGTVWGA